MSDLVIVRNDQGQLEGLGEKNRKAYARFKAKTKTMEIGETLAFSWREPRSPKFHKLFFAMLHELFERQEQFTDEDKLRGWLTVGAGYADFYPGRDGVMCAVPQSIAWDRMGDDEFRPLVEAVWAFLRTDHAQRFLWPFVAPKQAAEGVEQLLAGWN